MSTSEQHLESLRTLLNEFARLGGEVVIAKMIPEFAALIVALAQDLDRAQRKVVRLTWALFWLTLFLSIVGVAQLLAAFRGL